MSLILNIETSTKACSASLAENGKVIKTLFEVTDSYAHSKLLTVFIDTIFRETGTIPESLQAVAVSRGPGSYTGLRIGVSVAKGLAYGLSIPLISVDTLQLIASGFKTQNPKIDFSNSLFCPMIDARRMEVYHAIFDSNLFEKYHTKAEVITNVSFSEILKTQKIYFLGDGAKKCESILTSPNAEIIDSFLPSAEYMASFSEKYFNEKRFEDTAYFEPFYLKDFAAVVPTRDIYA
jgi:tRNA threonylcarbamoyladenosine biosynthesis protein TsaB